MSDEDSSPNLEFGTFNPIDAFEQTLSDLIHVIEAFQEPDSPMSPMDFLQAAGVAEERLNAINTVTLGGLIAPVQDKIPVEAQSEFRSQKELDDLMTSPEEKRKRMLKALRGVTTWHKMPPTA